METVSIESKQIRVNIPKEEYAKIMEIKFAEGKIESTPGEFALILIREALTARNVR